MSEAPKSVHPQLRAGVAAIEEARATLARMQDAVSNARINEAHARNRVNDEQAKFEALVAQVKKTAPTGTVRAEYIDERADKLRDSFRRRL